MLVAVEEVMKTGQAMSSAAREFAKGEFDKELALELDRKHEFPRKIWQKAAKLGFIGVHYPETYAGQGLGVMENILIAEEFCARDSGIGSAVILASFAAECVLRFGSEEATPLRLLGSCSLSTSRLLVAQRIRQHLAVSTGSVSTGSSKSSPARDRNAP